MKFLKGLARFFIISIVFLPIGLILNMVIHSKRNTDTFYIVDEEEKAAVPELVELNGLPESTSISYYPHSFQLASV